MFCKWCGMHIPSGMTKCKNCNREQETLSNGNIYEKIGISSEHNTAVSGFQKDNQSDIRSHNQKEIVKYIETKCVCRKCGKQLANQQVLCANCYSGEKIHQNKTLTRWKKKNTALIIITFVLLGICVLTSIVLISKNQLIKNKESQLEQMQVIMSSKMDQQNTEKATISDSEALTEAKTEQEDTDIESIAEWPEAGEQLAESESGTETINTIDETAGVYIDYQFDSDGNKYVVTGNNLFQYMNAGLITNEINVYWYKLLNHSWISISPSDIETNDNVNSLLEMPENEIGDAEVIACYLKTDNHVYRMKRNAVIYKGKYEPDQMSRIKDYLADARINNIPEVLTDAGLSYNKQEQVFEIKWDYLTETNRDEIQYYWYTKKADSTDWEYVENANELLYIDNDNISPGDLVVCYLVSREDVFEIIHEVTSEEITSEEITSGEMTSEEITSDEMTSEEITSEEITSEGMTSEEMISEKMTSEEITSEEVTSEKTISEENKSENEIKKQYLKMR